MLLFTWDVVRTPILIVFAFLEPFVRLILVGMRGKSLRPARTEN